MGFCKVAPTSVSEGNHTRQRPEFVCATQHWLHAFCGSFLIEANVRLCHKSKIFCSSQDVRGGLRCRPCNSKSPISQAGLRVLCARACRPFAGFFLYAVLQLPHEVSCLGKEEIWTAEREREIKNQTHNKNPNLFPVNTCWEKK